MSVPTDALMGTREPDAQADDVALGRALRAVAGGDDPDVVAAQPEVLVQEPDVLGDAAVLGVDVRADEADLHRRPRRPGLVARRAGQPAAGIAVVAAGAVATDAAARPRRGRRRPRLRSCCPNTPSWPAVPWNDAAVVVVPVSMARRRSAAVRPSKAVQPLPIAPEGVGVAVAHRGQAVSIGEAHDPIVPRSAERGRVERLERVGSDRRVRIVEQPAQHPALGAQRVRDERMGRDGQAAGIVDVEDRRPQRAVGPDRAARCTGPAGGRRGS